MNRFLPILLALTAVLLASGYDSSFWGKLSDKQAEHLQGLGTKYGAEAENDCGAIFISGMGGIDYYNDIVDYMEQRYNGTEFVRNCLVLRKIGKRYV